MHAARCEGATFIGASGHRCMRRGAGVRHGGGKGAATGAATIHCQVRGSAVRASSSRDDLLRQLLDRHGRVPLASDKLCARREEEGEEDDKPR